MLAMSRRSAADFKLESVNLFDNMVNKINNNTIFCIDAWTNPGSRSREPASCRSAPLHRRLLVQQYREEKQDLSDPHQQAAAEHDTREVKR